MRICTYVDFKIMRSGIINNTSMSHASRSPRTARLGYYDNKCSARSVLGNISNGTGTASNLRKYRLRYVEPKSIDFI